MKDSYYENLLKLAACGLALIVAWIAAVVFTAGPQ